MQCEIIVAKSDKVLIFGLGKENKTVVNVRQTFTIDGLPIRALSRADGTRLFALKLFLLPTVYHHMVLE